ncbi:MULTISPECIES: alpha/beta fold hydrolase [unclassified Halomonas]|uniref:alpha/beta fold hydrolase n=1 Tax=unclassified Halomonas TaxID=2609666 RepID=UPI003CF1E51C
MTLCSRLVSRVVRLAQSVFLVGMLTGCAVSSGGLASRLPAGHAAGVVSLNGNGFQLAAAERPGDGERVRVLIEGDGRPWLAGGKRVSDDPTPRDTPMLRQFLEGPSPALYLGRPCYFGMGPARQCHPTLWTFSRYSPRVVAALAEGLRTWLDRHPNATNVTLMGHSGGGVLALLVAEEVTAVDRVVAYAAPIDIALWSELHGFTPLFDSLNPAEINNWRADVSRLLIFGGQDQQVPAAAFTPAAHKIPGAHLTIMPAANHLPPARLTELDDAHRRQRPTFLIDSHE